MKILHLLADGPGKVSDEIITVQSKAHEIKVVDLSGGKISYDALVDDIFAFDKVVSW